MKLLKHLPILIILIGFSVLLIITQINQNKNRVNPVSEKNNYITKLNHALSLAQLKKTDIVIRDFQNEVEFNIINKETTKVLFSTNKDPYWQVASLQEIFNKATIRNKYVNFIDLSIDNPYATLQNN